MRASLAATALVAALSLGLPAQAAPSKRAAPAKRVAAVKRVAPVKPAKSIEPVKPVEPAPARAAPLPLSSLLARTFRMYGGVDALLGVGGLRVRGLVDDGTAAPTARPELERLLQPPGKFQSTVSLGGLERESLVLDGGRAFRDGLEVTGLARADQIRLEAARSFLPAVLARERAALIDRGETVRAGVRVRLVELRLHRKAMLTAELDASSGRILRTLIQVAGRESAVSYAELRPISGVLFPFAEEHVTREGRRRVVVTLVEIIPADAVRIEPPPP